MQVETTCQLIWYAQVALMLSNLFEIVCFHAGSTYVARMIGAVSNYGVTSADAVFC